MGTGLQALSGDEQFMSLMNTHAFMGLWIRRARSEGICHFRRVYVPALYETEVVVSAEYEEEDEAMEGDEYCSRPS